jgi:hypothetical protein
MSITLDTTTGIYTSPLVRLGSAAPRYRFAWDDEMSDWGFKCRTQFPGNTIDSDNPPAVLNYYSMMHEDDRQRVNLTKDPTWDWRGTVISLNGGDVQKFEYWTGSARAQFNNTGWPMFAYVGMCGNEIEVLETIGNWIKFKTLKPTDWLRARIMTRSTHPHLIHSFHCVTWDRATQTTKHILSTGTPRGVVLYPLVTNEGFAYIPKRNVVRL